jgi:hypothetical protein
VQAISRDATDRQLDAARQGCVSFTMVTAMMQPIAVSP